MFFCVLAFGGVEHVCSQAFGSVLVPADEEFEVVFGHWCLMSVQGLVSALSILASRTQACLA